MSFNRLKSDFFPCPITTNFSLVIDYELKSVSVRQVMQFLVKLLISL